jgi:bifunctional non-homologous end joining protein LigD
MGINKEASMDQKITIDRHELELTHLDKVYWPDEGYTKGDLIEYYRAAAHLMLPYLKDRPQSLNRFPHGIKGESFYQKDMDHQAPPWAKTVEVPLEHEHRRINYLVCQDKATLVYMANLGCIEINPWLSRIGHLDNPDFCVLDLDPEAVGFEAVIETARTIHKILDDAGVSGVPKTSGKTGLHIFIPLGAKYTYEQSREFGQTVAKLTNRALPKITSVERHPDKRQGRVYVDYLQNSRGQTVASAYSVRPAPGATVSAPLSWDEVKSGLSPAKFTMKNMMKRVDKVGDLWHPVTGRGIDLKRALSLLAK